MNNRRIRGISVGPKNNKMITRKGVFGISFVLVIVALCFGIIFVSEMDSDADIVDGPTIYVNGTYDKNNNFGFVDGVTKGNVSDSSGPFVHSKNTQSALIDKEINYISFWSAKEGKLTLGIYTKDDENKTESQLIGSSTLSKEVVLDVKEKGKLVTIFFDTIRLQENQFIAFSKSSDTARWLYSTGNVANESSDYFYWASSGMAGSLGFDIGYESVRTYVDGTSKTTEYDSSNMSAADNGYIWTTASLTEQARINNKTINFISFWSATVGKMELRIYSYDPNHADAGKDIWDYSELVTTIPIDVKVANSFTKIFLDPIKIENNQFLAFTDADGARHWNYLKGDLRPSDDSKIIAMNANGTKAGPWNYSLGIDVGYDPEMAYVDESKIYIHGTTRESNLFGYADGIKLGGSISSASIYAYPMNINKELVGKTINYISFWSVDKGTLTMSICEYTGGLDTSEQNPFASYKVLREVTLNVDKECSFVTIPFDPITLQENEFVAFNKRGDTATWLYTENNKDGLARSLGFQDKFYWPAQSSLDGSLGFDVGFSRYYVEGELRMHVMDSSETWVIESQPYTPGHDLAAPSDEFVPSGRTFAGWYLDDKYEGSIVNSLSVSGIDIYAKYVSTDTYNFFHNSDGSSKTVAVIGDSISTYGGIIPSGYAVWYPHSLYSGITADTMWWSHVIADHHAIRGTIGAWSDSRTVNGDKPQNTGDALPWSDKRISDLSEGGVPDIIMILFGVNDQQVSNSSTYRFDPYSEYVRSPSYDITSTTDPAEGYTMMLRKVMDAYPESQIIVIKPFYNGNSNARIDNIRNQIQSISDYYGLITIDPQEALLGDDNYKIDSSTQNNTIHPNVVGMRTLADAIEDQLAEKLSAPIIVLDQNGIYDANDDDTGIKLLTSRNPNDLNQTNHVYNTNKKLKTVDEIGYSDDGKTFIGWSLSRDSDMIVYADGADISSLLTTSSAGDRVVLYAVWKYLISADFGDMGKILNLVYTGDTAVLGESLSVTSGTNVIGTDCYDVLFFIDEERTIPADPVNARTYYIKIVAKGEQGYAGSIEDLVLNVVKAENQWIMQPSVSDTKISRVPYENGEAKFGTIVYEYYPNDNYLEDQKITDAINVDTTRETTYYVKAFVTGTDNFTGLDPVYSTFRIADKTIYEVESQSHIRLVDMSFLNDNKTVHFFVEPVTTEPSNAIKSVHLYYSYETNGVLKLDAEVNSTESNKVDSHGNFKISDTNSAIVVSACITYVVDNVTYQSAWITRTAQYEVAPTS